MKHIQSQAVGTLCRRFDVPIGDMQVSQIQIALKLAPEAVASVDCPDCRKAAGLDD